ncbi:MAG: bifunctional UDP-N-acetylglucosamine diphosphorylase/glucosamine-1-phosphate N-acetyltransferase GlmU, partial [Alphaproteobacteria bacterium]|nr:bifunctional UDP-N-acetylglucosamine diphosphorylase/glucosamine-1-phosphate N-acetyltransferase GlmU [Alphaproteobacteria bacterium]
MTTSPLAVLILAAGKGTRMRSGRPKVMHAIAGRPMIDYVLDAARALKPERLAVVIGPDMPELRERVAPLEVIVQPERLGTGHAVMAASAWLAGFSGDVLVLFGDTPRLTPATLARLLARRRAVPAPAAVALGMRPADPAAYGRLVTGESGELKAIVEYRDASPAERAIPLCNSGVMALDGARLPALLAALDNQNAKGEYYLTDVVAHARRMGGTAAYVEAPADELVGINARAELAAVEAAVQNELRARAMAGGATLIDPASVFFSFDTVLGEDVVVEPSVVFG